MKKRILSLLLVMVMLLGMAPMAQATVNLSASCTNYNVTFAVGGATVKEASATANGNDGTLTLSVENVTGNVTVTPTFSNISGAQGMVFESSASLDVSSGSASTSVRVMRMIGNRPQGVAGTWNINITAPKTATLTFTTDLEGIDAAYTVGDTANPLTVAATHSEGESVSYCWYSAADETSDGTAIVGATSASYTPGTEAAGTTYYYAVATAGGLTATGKRAKITVSEASAEEPPAEIAPVKILTGGQKPNKSWGYLDSITVDGVAVQESVWMGDTAYVTLHPSTPADAAVQLKFTMGGMRPAAMADSTVSLVDGKAEATYTAKTSAFNYSWTFKILFSNTGFAPTFVGSETASDTAYVGEAYTMDVSTLFSDPTGKALTYYVKEGSGEFTALTGSVYSFTPDATGTKEVTFKANNGKLDSNKTQVLTITIQNQVFYDMTVVLPEDIAPTFAVTQGFEADGTDIPGDAVTKVTKGETAEGMTAYTVNFKGSAQHLSLRAEDWGGMAFIPGENSTVTFCKVTGSLKDVAGKEVPGTVKATYGEHTVAAGEHGLLLMTGAEYKFTAAPAETSVYTAVSETKTVTEAGEITLQVGIANQKTITVSDGAEAELYTVNTSKYYYHTAQPVRAVVDNEGDTTTYYFSATGTQIYRVTMDGKLTKAGYWATGNSKTVLHTDADPADTYRPDYNLSADPNAGFAEDSVLLNVNGQNHLSLPVGESKTLKAYRAWEIIPVSYNNWIINPDFHFTVLSGEDVIRLEEKTSPSAGQGDWMTVTSLKEGTAVVEVTYGAMSVTGGNYDGTYGASDPARTGLVVITTSNVPSVDFGIDCKAAQGSLNYSETNKKPWDAEFDTLYFTGEKGVLTFAPAAQSAITEVAVSNDKGATFTALTDENGVYTADIVSGNNLLRVTTEEGAAYQVVRGDKLDVQFVNVTSPGQAFKAGDTVRVILGGLHMPIPKMAGNYNPGYRGNTDGDSGVQLRYTMGDTNIKSTGAQYTFITDANALEITVPAEGAAELTEGYISLGVIGLTNFASGGDSHRNIPDSGCTTRGNETTFHTRSLLPNLKISAGDFPTGNTAPYIRENAAAQATVTLGKTYAVNLTTVFADREGDAMTYKFGDADTEAYFTYTPTAAGTETLTFTASDGQLESYSHTITLTVTEAQGTPGTPTLDYGLTPEQIAGYVYVSFEDKGQRVEGESGVKYPVPLGTILSSVRVPYMAGDSIATVTVRALEGNGLTCTYTGTVTQDFYLGAIGGFTAGGVEYPSFGEFDVGSGSGWMITWNGEFINRGASAFTVKNGDAVRWQYTCQLGKDLNDPFYNNFATDSKTEEKTEDKKEETQTPVKLPFADMENHWGKDAVQYVWEKGLMNGTGETAFSPEVTASRAMVATILFRLSEETFASVGNAFADVTAGNWYTDAANWAAGKGIVTGYTDGTFGPDDAITREQLAVILFRYAKYKGVDVVTTEENLHFSDADTISEYAVTAVNWAVGQGFITGMGDGTLAPKGTATRAQLAAVLMRYLTK